MITDVLLFIVGAIVSVLSGIFSGLSYAIPSVIQNVIGTALGYISYFNGFFPIYPNSSFSGLANTIGIFTIVGYYLQFILVWYLVKLALFVFHMIPWLGKKLEMPNHK